MVFTKALGNVLVLLWVGRTDVGVTVTRAKILYVLQHHIYIISLCLDFCCLCDESNTVSALGIFKSVVKVFLYADYSDKKKF